MTALQDQLLTSSMGHPWVVTAQHYRKNFGYFQLIQRTNKTLKNCDETWNTLRVVSQIIQKIKKKCSLYMDHMILKKSQFPAREPRYTWRGENRKKSVPAFSYREKVWAALEMQCYAVDSYFMVFLNSDGMVHVSTVALLLLRCWDNT